MEAFQHTQEAMRQWGGEAVDSSEVGLKPTAPGGSVRGSEVGWALAHLQNRQQHVNDTEGGLKPTPVVWPFRAYATA